MRGKRRSHGLFQAGSRPVLVEMGDNSSPPRVQVIVLTREDEEVRRFTRLEEPSFTVQLLASGAFSGFRSGDSLAGRLKILEGVANLGLDRLFGS